MTLGERLKYNRTKADLTQREVNKKTGINYKTLSNWENDVSKPSPDDLIILANTYNVTTDYLLGLSDQPQGHQADSPAAARQQPQIQPDTLTPEEAALVEAYRNANDRDKSIVDTVLKPEVRAQSEAVEETPLSTAERIGQKIINASPDAIIREDVG